MCKDTEGNEYKSEREMCKKLGLSINTYKWRKKNGWKMPELILGKDKDKVVRQVDHLGMEYGSELEMCEEWGISLSTYRHRRQLKWSLKRSLEEATREMGIKYRGNR